MKANNIIINESDEVCNKLETLSDEICDYITGCDEMQGVMKALGIERPNDESNPNYQLYYECLAEMSSKALLMTAMKMRSATIMVRTSKS